MSTLAPCSPQPVAEVGLQVGLRARRVAHVAGGGVERDQVADEPDQLVTTGLDGLDHALLGRVHVAPSAWGGQPGVR